MSTAQRMRRALIVVLAAVVGYGAWQLTRPQVDPFVAGGEQALNARFDAYVSLRIQDDWPKIWEMVDPEERASMDLASFLGIYGQAVMKTHEITKHDVDINFNTRTARMKVTTEAELQVSKLPAQFRAGLRVDDPRDLQRTLEHELMWVWHEGEWYFSLDEEVLQGTTSEGRQVSPVDES